MQKLRADIWVNWGIFALISISLFLVIIVSLLFLGPSIGAWLENRTSRADDVGQYQQRWAAKDIRSYRYVIEPICFCNYKTMLIEVHDGVISSAKYLYSDESVNPETIARFGPIEQVFAIIIKANNLEADTVFAKYHWRYSYPTYIEIDHDVDAHDDEMFIKIKQFEIIR